MSKIKQRASTLAISLAYGKETLLKMTLKENREYIRGENKQTGKVGGQKITYEFEFERVNIFCARQEEITCNTSALHLSANVVWLISENDLISCYHFTVVPFNASETMTSS